MSGRYVVNVFKLAHNGPRIKIGRELSQLAGQTVVGYYILVYLLACRQAGHTDTCPRLDFTGC